MIHTLDPHPTGQPGVLLLHGLGTDSMSWTLQMEPLAEAGFRPIAVDVPGFGHSPFNGKAWSIPTVTEIILQHLRKLEASPVHVVGISMGGVFAQQLAINHPEIVKKLVLVNTFSTLRPRTIERWIYFRLRQLMVLTVGITKQAKVVAKKIFPKAEQEYLRQQLIASIAQANPQAYRAAMYALKDFDSSDRLHMLRMPVLVITGENDTTVAMEDQQFLAREIPGARQVVIPGGGHGVSVDSYEAFNKALIDFLVGE